MMECSHNQWKMFLKLDILNNLMATLAKRSYKKFLPGSQCEADRKLVWVSDWWNSLHCSSQHKCDFLCGETFHCFIPIIWLSVFYVKRSADIWTRPREWWKRPQSDAFKEAIVPIMIRWLLLKSEQLRMKHVARCQWCTWLFISCNGVCNWIQVHNYQQLVILNQIC